MFGDLIPRPMHESAVPSFTKLGAMSDEEVMKLIEEELSKQAVLVYCEPAFKD